MQKTCSYINMRICVSAGLLGWLIAASLGCTASGIQTHSPIIAAPFVVGSHACPHCGLLQKQGCCCRPASWNNGYHETSWRRLDPPYICEVPNGFPEQYPEEIIVNGADRILSPAREEITPPTNRRLRAPEPNEAP